MEIATEALIKFIKLFLTEISESDFRGFPDSIYLTRKELELKDHFHSFVSCSPNIQYHFNVKETCNVKL
ncbi:5243_t:CDS:2 [Funneliformis geosporum]|uniref:5243_t:CDS:1 n=1 Tax=Funneliformis geosporum TaxID=1117311 RepID=A0A9W4WY52_9GLOM|nr:5243_t:CDS:2 [Funneliformis geosporum]